MHSGQVVPACKSLAGKDGRVLCVKHFVLKGREKEGDLHNNGLVIL